MVLNCGGTHYLSPFESQLNWDSILGRNTAQPQTIRQIHANLCVYTWNERTSPLPQHAVIVGSHSSLWSNPFFLPAFHLSLFFLIHGKEAQTQHPIQSFGLGNIDSQFSGPGPGLGPGGELQLPQDKTTYIDGFNRCNSMENDDHHQQHHHHCHDHY